MMDIIGILVIIFLGHLLVRLFVCVSLRSSLLRDKQTCRFGGLMNV